MHLDSLEGKVALVTGAGNGIGAATAQRLSREGALVAVVDIDGAAAAKVVSTLPGTGIAITCDVAIEKDVDYYIKVATKEFGRIDLYHFNAGRIGTFTPLPELSECEFQKTLDVNLKGPFLGIRAAFRQYARQNSNGSIVVTGSIGSLRASHDLLAYQTSKHGVVGLVRGAAMYGGPLGIRVNAVAPGLVPTGLFAAHGDAMGGGDDMLQRGSTVPLRRTGTPQEVASTVAFLLSEDAGYIHGEVVSVDGGAAVVNTVRPSGGAGRWDVASIDERPELASWANTDQ